MKTAIPIPDFLRNQKNLEAERKSKMIPPKKKTRQIVRTGDVISIPLPDGRYAFGLQMGSVTAIYSLVADSPDTPPLGHRKFLFAVGIYTDVLSNLAWRKVSKDKVTKQDEEFANFGYVEDGLNGSLSTYVNDDMHPATMKECLGLEPVSAWDAESIIDRIVCSLNGEKTIWLDHDPWVPYALDMTDLANMKRVPVKEIL